MGGERLGDIIDDFCPRCRLLTNHSIAAIVGDDIKKVVCRTCGNTHDFRHGKGSEKKAKTSKQSAFDQVLASVLSGKNIEPKPPAAPKISRSLGQARGAHPRRTGRGPLRPRSK